MNTIHLRALEPEDLDLLYTIENDRTLWDVGTATAPYSRYILHDYLAQSTGDIYTDKQVRLVIETDTHEAVGLVDLFNFNPQHLRAEVGIVVLQSFRQKGLAKEALMQLADYACHNLHLHQLYAIVSGVNRSALELFLSAGYQTRATLDDWLYDGEKYVKAHLLQTFL